MPKIITLPLEEKWNSLLKKIGELEDKEEEILGKEVAEEFFRTRKIDPNWNDDTKKKITELEKQIGLLMKKADTLLHREDVIWTRNFIREVTFHPEQYEFKPKEILKDCLKRVSSKEMKSILKNLLKEADHPKIRELLDLTLRKGEKIKKAVSAEKKKAEIEFKVTVKEYMDFISKYADPNKINFVDVGNEFFRQNLIGKQFTVVDVLEQDLGAEPSVVYAILEVNGEKCILRDDNTTYVDYETRERGASLGRKLAYITKYRQLPLKVAIERLKTKMPLYKWKIIQNRKS